MPNDEPAEQVTSQNFQVKRERIATHCVCCGSKILISSPAVLMPFVAHRTFGWEPVCIDDSWELTTIKNGQAYSICKSLHCGECGLLFLDIRFTETELSNLYRDYRGMEYTSLRETYEPGYTLRNDNLNAGIAYMQDIEEFLRPYLKFPISILDWGGHTGKNTPFKNENESLDIFDINNTEVIEGARIVSKSEAHSKKYKLIVCSNVLEHVPYPSDVLNDIIKAMDTETVLYIEVPFENVMMNNQNDLQILKKHWHEHINFYSEKSLYRLIKNVGLDVISLKVFQDSTRDNFYLFQVACKTI